MFRKYDESAIQALRSVINAIDSCEVGTKKAKAKARYREIVVKHLELYKSRNDDVCKICGWPGPDEDGFCAEHDQKLR